MQGPLKFTTLTEIQNSVGQEIGVSDWFEMTQQRISAFADITEDHMFLHVDPERAAHTPFGGTIAHGLLTLSMLSVMAYQAVPAIEGMTLSVNYGYNKVRFIAPVPSGSRIRGRFLLNKLDVDSEGRVTLTVDVTVEIDGQDKPALVAEWVMMVWT